MIEIRLKKKLFGNSGNFELDGSLHFGKGEVVALYGPSGSGKTSLLRMIAGVLPPTSGRIVVDGETWYDSDKKINLRPQQRHVGIVFQDYALFPNMTVRDNILYGKANDQPDSIVGEVMQLMELDQLHNKKPNVLSGGQRQRTALARAIVRRPTLLLLDEPFAALDTEMRLKVQEYLRVVHQQFKITTILVSHDVLDVVNLASKVFMLEGGTIQRSGTPSEMLPLSRIRDFLSGLDTKS